MTPTFLPWLRLGLAAHIGTRAVDGLAAHDVATATVAVRLVANGESSRSEQVPSPPVRLRGPVDVIGLSPGEISRCEPVDGATDAEPNYFAHVEFASPDLPWRFTPAAADAKGRLQPWLALVVVEDRPGVSLEGRGSQARSILHVDEASAELPDLAQCWAWAHVQADCAVEDGVAAALRGNPAAFRARLMCPRRLPPDRSWIACVVPTFEAGRRVALGEPVEGQDLGLAWSQTDVDVRLPVYHSWRFSTGPSGDFESLVRRLTPRELAASVGRRDLDVSSPGEPLPSVPSMLLSFKGALVSPGGEDRPWPARHYRAFAATFRDLIRQQYDASQDDPIVGAPAYGAVQAHGVDGEWFGELNTEPPHRVVASLGASVVRRDQEAMMAAAWQYAAEHRSVNRLLGRARLGWEVARVGQSKLDVLTDSEILQLAGPALARLRKPSGGTLRAALAASAVPAGLVSGAMRRRCRTVNGLAPVASVTDAVLADPVGFGAAWQSVRAPAAAELQAASSPSSTSDLSGSPLGSVYSGGVASAGVPASSSPAASASGAAHAGRASVPGHPGTGPMPPPSGGASAPGDPGMAPASPPSGRASAPGDPGMAPASPPSGRASVPGHPGTGRAAYPSATGRASVPGSGGSRPGAHGPAVGRAAVGGPPASSDPARSGEEHDVARSGDGSGDPEQSGDVGGVVQSGDAGYQAERVGGGVSEAGQGGRAIAAARGGSARSATAVRIVGQAGVAVPSVATDIAIQVRAVLEPAGAIAKMVASRVAGMPSDIAHPVPGRVWASPRFTNPMYTKVNPEMLLPGVGEIPADTLGLLETNPQFLEAFLTGLNYELAREFRWREYPASLDDTWARHFWDTGPEGPADIVPMGKWARDSALGQHRPQGTPGADLVLLIKGALPRRYPDMRVYAAEAQWSADGKKRLEKEDGIVKLPVLAGKVGRDIHFYGFALSAQDARGSTDPAKHPGYFMVLEQRPESIRFGLDAPRPRLRGKAPGNWSDLSWAHLVAAEETLPGFVDTGGPDWMVDAGELPGNGGKDGWGEDAAAMARITLQRPVRMLTHASGMLPEGEL